MLTLRVQDSNGNIHNITITYDTATKLFLSLWKELILNSIDDPKKQIKVKNFLIETIKVIDKAYMSKEYRLQYLDLKDIISRLVEDKTRTQITLKEIYEYYRRPIGQVQIAIIKLIFDEFGWILSEEKSIVDNISEYTWYRPIQLDEYKKDYLRSVYKTKKEEKTKKKDKDKA